MKSHATRRHREGRLPSVRHVVLFATHLSLVQSVVAAAKVVFAMALLSVHAPLAPAVGALMAFAVYNANNLTDVEEDAVTRPECAAVTERFRREIAAAAAVAATVAAGMAVHRGGPPALAVVAVPVLAGALYSMPLLPGPGPDRLKDVLGVNTALVAAAWAVPLTYLPVAIAGDVGLWATVPVCAILLLRTAVSVEVFNVRDVAGDRRQGVATLPATLGIPATQRALLTVDALALGVAVAAAAVLPPLLVLALVPVTAASMVITAVLDRVRDRRLLCLAKDGEYLLLGVVALAVV